MSFWCADVNLIALDKASTFIKSLKFLLYLLLVILFMLNFVLFISYSLPIVVFYVDFICISIIILLLFKPK